MKTDINTVLNTLVAYATDNLMLDPLDYGYTLNRLASVVGVPCPKMQDVDGDVSLDELLDALTVAVPTADKAAVMDVLFPMPRTVNMHFGAKLERNPEKAFELLYDLYAHGYHVVSTSDGAESDGYYTYTANGVTPLKAAALTVGDETLYYAPKCVYNRVATLDNPDILTDDLIMREVAFAAKYGEAIAARIGAGADYMCCAETPLSKAPVKTVVSDGAVKINLIKYPVPALSFTGIAKNAVVREVGSVVKAVTEAGVPCVVAADNTNGVTLYVVFAKELGASEFITDGGALSACGVVAAKDCSPLLSVLEKGTALSTDLAEYRPIYDKIGGVKHGKNAIKELGSALIAMYLPLLTAAASATEEQAVAFAAAKQ